MPLASPPLSRVSSHQSATASSSSGAAVGSNSGGGSSSSGSSSDASSSGLDLLKSKLSALRSDALSKEAQVSSLREQVAELIAAQASAASRAHDELQAQKNEYESLLASSQSFVEKILHEKSELNSQVASLNSRLESLGSESATKEAEFRSTVLSTELKKAKEHWISAERTAREGFLAHRTKQIQSELIAAMEPEVNKALVRERAERKEAEEMAMRRAAAALADARADHEALIGSIRKQHITALEHAREEERMGSQRKLRECIDRYDALMQEMRSRHSTEMEELRTRLAGSSSSLASAVDAALLSARQEFLVEKSKAHEASLQELNDRERRHTLLLATEREKLSIEKDAWIALTSSRLSREADARIESAKRELTKGHEEEISMLVSRLGGENQSVVRDVVRECERKIDAAKRAHAHELAQVKKGREEAQTKLAALQSNHATVEDRLRAASTRLAALQAELSEKTSALSSAADSLVQAERRAARAEEQAESKFASEKKQLRAEFRSMQARLDEASKRDAAHAGQMEAAVADAVARKEQEHARALEATQGRVKELLAKKEGLIDALKKRVADAERDAHNTQQELERQRRELLDIQ